MPIDFAAAVARFAALAFQSRLATQAGRAVEAALTRRRTAVRAAELGTRDLPVLPFQDGAVGVWVTSARRSAAGGAFTDTRVGPLAAIGTARAAWVGSLRAANDIPAFVESIDRLLASADESITRYATPTPGAFDPRDRTVLDLVGIIAAFHTAVKRASTPGGELDRLGATLLATVGVLRAEQPATPPVGSALRHTATPDQPPVVWHDDARSSVLALSLTFAALPELVSVLLAGIDIRVRLWALVLLETVEKAARKAIAAEYELVLGSLRRLGGWLLGLVHGLQAVTGTFVRAGMAFVPAFGLALAGAVRDFVFELARLLKAVVGLLGFVTDLLELLGLDRWVPSDIPIGPEAPPLNFRSNFPEFGRTAFGDEVRAQVARVVTATGEGVRTRLAAGFDRTANGLRDAAGHFTSVADAVARDETGHLSPRLPADADFLAATLLGAEPPRAQRDPLALALESWLAAGGVRVLAAALEAYGERTAQLWHARFQGEPALVGPAPTSPHLLRRHAVPVRVEVPRVLVHVGGPADDRLVEAVAAEFAAAVRGAYRDGARRLRAGSGAVGR
ncbi:hypothetical protein ALI22I_01165 [Saccharothrix sp. ALI-22-I]|uniref:hypothetical protein n=1 Tax=Saccharothrix sp. ALI-22-I TaxID=1933778 RepID=UPI00097C63AC|nr:hypothetical protein [Saccharothrix sp. ALI-22-I]ONI92913.1 hypothetical protein ALI22I_01165 [Saccharothrix sp. ALI-22-I]